MTRLWVQWQHGGRLSDMQRGQDNMLLRWVLRVMRCEHHWRQ